MATWGAATTLPVPTFLVQRCLQISDKYHGLADNMGKAVFSRQAPAIDFVGALQVHAVAKVLRPKPSLRN